MKCKAGAYLTQAEFDAVCPSVSPTACCVYVALVTCRNAKTGRTGVVGTPLLAKKTGKSRTQVFSGLKELKQAGFISNERTKTGCVYSFILS